jgi:hypothetical protein
MAAKEISVKRYVVRLNGEEREQLAMLIRKGKSPAQRLLKARILLKADLSASANPTAAPRRAELIISKLRSRLSPPGSSMSPVARRASMPLRRFGVRRR